MPTSRRSSAVRPSGIVRATGEGNTYDTHEATAVLPLTEDRKVDARSLHGWLGVGRRFPSWIAAIFDAYAFEEGTDFVPVRGESTGGRPRKDYLLTLDAAKEIAMIGNTARGHRQGLPVCSFYVLITAWKESILPESPKRSYQPPDGRA